MPDISIQLCLQTKTSPRLYACKVRSGTTIEQALKSFELAPEWDISTLLEKGYAISIYGKKRDLDTVLQDADRIEICGPLIASPMDARRRRAKREHKGGKM